MKIITCNFRGRKHSERNEQCEDSVYFLRGTEVTTVAVADGAGSKKYEYAKEGADTVTKAVCNFFDSKFDDFFDSNNEIELRSVIQTICHKSLKERANELGIDSIETMASTLLAVSFKGNKAVAIQIGDGVVGRYIHSDTELVTMPQNGEFASSTFFVNSAEAYKMIQVRKMFLNSTSHLFLMTDGIADCMYNDFTGAFNNSLKLILEASDDYDGEEKVKSAIKEFIVDADPTSDDCTMAIVSFNEFSQRNEVKKPIVQQEFRKETEVASKKDNTVQDTVKTESVVVASVDNYHAEYYTDTLETERDSKKTSSKLKLLAIIVSVILIIGVVIGVVFINGNNTEDKNTERETTSEKIETSTSHTESTYITLSGIGSSNDGMGVIDEIESGIISEENFSGSVDEYVDNPVGYDYLND